ncbi:MAG: hypothetical protein HQL09_08890 [Nitrospirae bacterium]|nr:hypothetical protein [Nitrospirota bacterium]
MERITAGEKAPYSGIIQCVNPKCKEEMTIEKTRRALPCPKCKQDEFVYTRIMGK